MRAEGTLRRRIIAIAWATLFAACSDNVGPNPPPPPPPPPPSLIVSNPLQASASATAGTFSASRSAASPAAADSIVYVSLTPGTASGGSSATIHRVGSADSADFLTTAVLDGGFDPLPINANVGDSIEVVVTDQHGAVVGQPLGLRVSARRPPVVVRTEPPPRKRDVPLNTAIVVVFSEPVAGASLSTASLQLRAGQSAVSGTVRFVDPTLDATHVTAEFVPDAPLSANTEYSLVVTQQVRDLDGDALAARDTATFNTGTVSTGAPASVEISPYDSVMRAGTTRQLRATVRDADGNTLTNRAVAWSSSDPASISVSSTGLLTSVGVGSALVTARVDPSVAGVFHIQSVPGPATSITMVPTTATVAAGDTVRLTATAHDARGFPAYVGWSSSAADIATFGSGGEIVIPVGQGSATMTVAVIGVRQGSATITAASASAKATAVVTVTPAVPVGSVNVTPAVDTLVLLDVPNVQLTATVRDSTDRLIGRQVTWTSDNAAVASVDANGLVTAAGPGKATIAATSEGVSGHADVSVLPAPPVASVTIVPESATVIVLDQPYVRLTATLRDSGGRAIVRPISWVSDNGSVATVDVNGLVTAVSPGRVAITATSEVVSDTATVTVLPPAPVASVRIGPDSARLVAQGTQQFAVTISDASGRTLTGRSVGWTSDNGAVASVDANGLVTGLAPGSASVTATSEGVSDTAAITVIVVQFSTVSAGNAFTCGLTTGGDAYCWGWELGVGNNVVHTFPAAVRGGIKFTALTSGRYGACGVTAAGAAYCWGQNSRWPTEPVAGGLTFASLNRGVEHTCGVTSSGAAYCWGLNLVGDLGNGDTSHVLVAVPVRVSGGLTFASVSVGEYHSCGLTTQGAAYCWGDNGWRQLGDGTTISSAVPVAVFGGLRFTALDAGLRHTCAVSTGGTIYCWGSGGFGELGSGTTNSSAVPIPVFGSNVYTSVNAGDDVSCGITNSGRADCWGLNGFGQLGTGSSTGPQQCSGYPCSTTPVSVVGNLTFSELSVGDGEGHTCGRTSSGVVYCWGGNRYGQLGNGTTTDSKVPVRVLGQP